nr:salivary glue protein Sgs-3-like [Procambarus clarkii]
MRRTRMSSPTQTQTPGTLKVSTPSARQPWLRGTPPCPGLPTCTVTLPPSSRRVWAAAAPTTPSTSCLELPQHSHTTATSHRLSCTQLLTRERGTPRPSSSTTPRRTSTRYQPPVRPRHTTTTTRTTRPRDTHRRPSSQSGHLRRR